MPSSLFSRPTQNLQNNPMMQILQNIRSTGNPQALAQNMLNSNPQFKAFYEQNKDKPIEQIAKENGIDIAQFKQMLGMK